MESKSIYFKLNAFKRLGEQLYLTIDTIGVDRKDDIQCADKTKKGGECHLSCRCNDMGNLCLTRALNNREGKFMKRTPP